ncbi:MAG: LysE family transporter [Bacteroidales bacterium]|jgi:threonine/homoserine/homoserine lactone efflux protein|nr:LysE family transporter [Bacteroidales bacterium]
MELVFLFKGLVVGFVASIPLGPVGVLSIQRTINKGLSSGVISGMGAAFVDTIYAIIAILGISYIINFIEQQQLYIELIGGSVLIFLGFRIFRTNPIKQLRRHRKNKSSYIEDFFSIVFLTLSNPLAVFLFIAAFAGLGMAGTNEDQTSSILIIIGVFFGAVLWWLVLSSLVELFRAKFRLKQLWWINKIAGLAILAFGIIIFFSAILF